jgi:hypothetical protein
LLLDIPLSLSFDEIILKFVRKEGSRSHHHPSQPLFNHAPLLYTFPANVLT